MAFQLWVKQSWVDVTNSYLVSALLCFEVFFRVLFEDYLASGSAEIVGFSLVNRLMSRRFLVHFHLTNWINCQSFFTSLNSI